LRLDRDVPSISTEIWLGNMALPTAERAVPRVTEHIDKKVRATVDDLRQSH
jgi:hypothetical protein